MSDHNDEIGKGCAKARRKALLSELRRPTVVIVVLLVPLAMLAGFSFYFTPVRLRETVVAYGLSDFATYEDNLKRATRHVTAKLENGRIVTFVFPNDELFSKDKPMKIAIYERVWGPIRYESQRFAGYTEKTP